MLISVITVSRNDISGLRQTFESIRTQDHNAIEWWVVDGASTDGTVEWLRENHHLRGGWISEPDKGIYDAMNKGTGASAGEYLVFMNSGDMFAQPDVITELVRAIERGKTAPDFIFGDSLDVDEGGKVYYRKAMPVSGIKLGMITRHQAMLYRRALMTHDPYPLKFKLSADYALTALVLMKDGVKVLQIDFPICRFSLGGAHTTQRLKALREDFQIRNTILKENYLTCTTLFCIHWVHHYVRKMLPALNREFIYKSL